MLSMVVVTLQMSIVMQRMYPLQEKMSLKRYHLLLPHFMYQSLQLIYTEIQNLGVVLATLLLLQTMIQQE